MRRERLILPLVLATTVLASPGAAVEARPGDQYVPLGDSFTAGPLIPTQIAPLGCLKSNRNYPTVVDGTLGSSAFRDISCSGATTDDMFAPQSIVGGSNPAQLSALSASTTLVTLGIGANDIGFTEIIQHCSTLNPFATPCRNR
ncbi:MAG: hypothetical protein H0U21_06265 [Acidimicrobiia bacterium]|nr:hypothetical protein [Acidimicrobiia bacterium]